MTCKHAQTVQDDVGALRAGVYRELIKKYGNLSGTQVLMALKDASEDIYESGVDRGLHAAKIWNLDNVADAWDLTWLTALAIRLNRL